MILSTPLLAAATGMKLVQADRWTDTVNETAARYEINTDDRMSMFLAQCGHESAGFLRLVENLNYGAEGLRKTWPKRFPDDATALRFARHPEKIANYVYADRMGNGDAKSGDGWKFRGRGLIQLTGRDRYKSAGLALGQDFVAEPDLVATDHWAALTAGWFWDERELNRLADLGDVAAVTRVINGGLHGLEDRKRRYVLAMAAIREAAA